MTFSNKTISTPKFLDLKSILNNNKKSWLPNSFLNEKVAVKIIENDDVNVLKMWKTNTIFDYGYENFNFNNFILLLLCFKIKNNYLKIDALELNIENLKLLNEINEAKEILNMIIIFIKKIARNRNIYKIFIDVNLKNFNEYYKKEGFKLTDNVCYDNPDCYEAELDVY